MANENEVSSNDESKDSELQAVLKGKGSFIAWFLKGGE
jgi:hypothetical protein